MKSIENKSVSSKRPIDNDNAMKLIEKLVEKGLRYLKRPINDKNVFVNHFVNNFVNKPPNALEDEIVKITKLNHSVNISRLENELANNFVNTKGRKTSFDKPGGGGAP